MAENVRQHYIPQCYLNYFGHEKDGASKKNKGYFLNILNKNRMSIYTKSVEDVCQIEHFYRLSDITVSKETSLTPLTLENEVLGDGIESEYNDLLQSLFRKKEDALSQGGNVFPLVTKEKNKLAEFIAIQYLRMPLYRKQIMELTRQGYPKMMEVFKHLVAKVENKPEISQMALKYNYDEAMIHAEMGFLNPKFVYRIKAKLLNCKWLFAYSPFNEISTSNNPIVSCSSEDGNPSPIFWNSSLVFFPLFPDVLLIMMPDKIECDTPDCTFVEIQKEALALYHSYLAIQSTEIYNYNNNFDMIMQFLRKQA